MKQDMPVIGKTRKINIIGHANGVPAKIDTGADSSAIWATDIRVSTDGILHFKLFGEDSPYYTGEVLVRKDFKVAQVASSNGQTQIRYRVTLPIRLGGRRIRTLFNLSDRSGNKFPILLGRRTITGKFLVDVTKGLKVQKRFSDTERLNRELKKDPYAFYQKYHNHRED